MTSVLSPPPAPARDAASNGGSRRWRPRRQVRVDASHRLGPLGSLDRLAPFGPAILAIRWSTTVVTAGLAVGAFVEPGFTVIPWVVAVVANTVIRTVTPVEDDGTPRSALKLLLEVALHVLAVALTGYWSSPLVFSLVAAVIVTGFARGFGFAVRVSVAASLAVTLPGLAHGWTHPEMTASAQWSAILILVGLVAGYARRISGEANRQHTLTLDRLSRLADANSLLFSLHRIAQTLPASLDTDEVLESTIRRLRGLIEHHAAAILLVDDTDGSWIVGRRHGLRLEPRLQADDLPVPALIAAQRQTIELVDNLSITGPGFAPGYGAGLYAPLTARGRLVGLLVIEHRDAGRFGEREREIVQGFIEPVSLAIDNARWFARLRTVSADEERTRIARDLHDRIGQSLAYLAFELDRIVKRDEDGDPISAELTHLRADLRGVIGEVRDTLYDLRTDVTEDKDFPAVLHEFTGRIADRGDLRVVLDCGGQRRLSLLQEREFWRIAQEALTNVERHASARLVKVVWRCDGSSAVLEVVDDGTGFPDGRAGRLDSYGILGMKERASSIGATFEIRSTPGEGTTVRCYLEQR